MKDKFKVYRDFIAFWMLGLLNNFLYVAMNAGAQNINEAGIGWVYFANILPTLIVKLSGPYWFHYISYRGRVNLCAGLMAICLVVVAWGNSTLIKLLGVGVSSFACGIGEASLLAMASFYEAKPCIAAWSSGTGFAGIAGYAWSLAFGAADICFQVQLMVALWIPVAWLLAFHMLLGPPWIDRVRDVPGMHLESDGEEDFSSSASESAEHSVSEVITAKLSARGRFRFILSLWPYMVPLFLVYAAEYTIQAGFWAAMGFPVTDINSRHSWYKWANFTYQIGVFISRSSFVLVCRSRKVLWMGGIIQVLIVGFFASAALTPYGSWWLLAPALVVGLLGGGVYVGAFSLIATEQDPAYVELALSGASVADTFGIITANILSLIVQGCVFGQMNVLDTKPDFTCGYHTWDNYDSAVHPHAYATHCFPGVRG